MDPDVDDSRKGAQPGSGEGELWDPSPERLEALMALALPYYERGRPFDVAHIRWMVGRAASLDLPPEICRSDLILLCLLHDVGYCALPGRELCWEREVRVAHMQRGAATAARIMREAGISLAQAWRVSYFVCRHDDWALGDNDIYRELPVLGAFNDLDFLWGLTPEGFSVVRRLLAKTPAQMLDYYRGSDKYANRPFAAPATRELFRELFLERAAEAREGARSGRAEKGRG